MSERIFENENGFEVSDRSGDIDFTVNGDRTLTIHATEEGEWNSQSIFFMVTAEEATAMKNFLIKQGY
jgi:hypothetical protein